METASALEKREGSTTVLPPRNQSELSRPQVTRDVPLPSQVDGLASTSFESEACSVLTPQFMRQRSPRSSPRSKPSPPLSKYSPTPTPIYSQAPSVSIVGVHAFAMLCNQPDTELFVMSYQPSPGSPPTKDPLTPSVVEDCDLSGIPSEYHEFADLFSKTESEKPPPHRPYHHTIPLEPGTTPTFGPIYSMSPKELEALKDYCET